MSSFADCGLACLWQVSVLAGLLMCSLHWYAVYPCWLVCLCVDVTGTPCIRAGWFACVFTSLVRCVSVLAGFLVCSLHWYAVYPCWLVFLCVHATVTPCIRAGWFSCVFTPLVRCVCVLAGLLVCLRHWYVVYPCGLFCVCVFTSLLGAHSVIGLECRINIHKGGQR